MKIFVVKHKNVTLLAGFLAVCAIFYSVSYPSAVGAYATDRQLPIYCVDKDQKVCSISFDAAWGNEDTQMLIDILEQYKVKATFFVVGQWVDKYPESVKALSDAGHEVMNHSATHAHYNQLSADEITADVNTCNDKVEAVTGVRPTLIRCPYGEYDDHVVSAIRSIGMEPIQWDVDVCATAATPVRSVLSQQEGGEVPNGTSPPSAIVPDSLHKHPDLPERPLSLRPQRSI
ncbi:polysaccharide deacetylase family protein [Oscillibacter sp. MSJ-2]|uniref:Polysaccharide deacetylase family protein n=1 Tax=Dysosmobacter acutus TaxID=2841504 RepID=A0ABS6F8P4_9FIRM|nr:polysaccharide deacetylase family protein [Dysosmobacter acutus]MBU5626659.1 polysaccharide deacetylase family protein [Dysosmobacter acutus]